MTIYRKEDLNLSTLQAWNTGRPYSDNGQDLAACMTTDGKVVMADFTRDLAYVYNLPSVNLSAILAAYDNNASAPGCHVSNCCVNAMKAN